MAPKKNRINVEQDPDRASPPSKPGPGATRRQRQKPKKLRRRVSWPVLQNATELYTPFAPFVRLVKEITESCSSQVKRWTVDSRGAPLVARSAGEEQGEEHAGGSPEEAEEA